MRDNMIGEWIQQSKKGYAEETKRDLTTTRTNWGGRQPQPEQGNGDQDTCKQPEEGDWGDNDLNKAMGKTTTWTRRWGRQQPEQGDGEEDNLNKAVGETTTWTRWGGRQQPEQGDGQDADDEQHGVAHEHLGQGDLLWRHTAAGRRLSPPCCSLPKFYRRYDRRRRHHRHHHPRETHTVHEGVQVVDELLVVQVELSRHDWPEGDVANRVVHTCDSIARNDEEIKSQNDSVDDDDDSGSGGGTQQGLGAEWLQDAEASLAGDDCGQDLRNPGKAEETRQVVVGYILCDRSIPVNRQKPSLTSTFWFVFGSDYGDKKLLRSAKRERERVRQSLFFFFFFLFSFCLKIC